MNGKPANKFPVLQLTDACNKSCRACLRSPHATKHRLSVKELAAYVEDLQPPVPASVTGLPAEPLAA